MNLSEKCFTFMLALIAQSYGLLDGVQNSSAWYFCEVPRWDGKCGKEHFSWCFLFHEVFCDFGPDTIYPCPFTLFIHSYDLNNGTPMFCLLAVLLFFIAAEEECLDYQPLSQRTLWTVIIFLFFLSIFLKKKKNKTMSPWWNHKIGLQDFSGRLPNLKKKRRKKRNIFPDFRCKGTISFSKQQSDELYSQMTINVEQEISSKLCALIFSEHRPD